MTAQSIEVPVSKCLGDNCYGSDSGSDDDY